MKIKQRLKKLLTLFCALIIVFSAAGCSCGVNGGGVTPLSFSFYSFEDFLAFHNEFSQKSNIAESILAFDFDTDSTINKSYMITCNTVSEDNIKKHNLNKSDIAKFLNEQPKVFFNSDTSLYYLPHSYRFVCSRNSDNSAAEYDPNKNGFIMCWFGYNAVGFTDKIDIKDISFKFKAEYLQDERSEKYRGVYAVCVGNEEINEISLYLNEKDDGYAAEVLQMLSQRLVILEPNK